MKLQGNTIFITGGGSGIGRGFAEALHKLGNDVIISGRRKQLLEEVTKQNPGMTFVELDVNDPADVKAASQKLIKQHPNLNVLINNAGIMKMDDAATKMDDQQMVSQISTNLMGPIRITSEFVEHLKQQPNAAIINVTSGLAFVPLALTAVYSATKAALHSYTMSLRYMLKDSNVKVLEIAPPYVQTDLMNGANDPRSMKLDDFTAETIKLLQTENDEILVERVMQLRNNVGRDEFKFVVSFNNMLREEPARV